MVNFFPPLILVCLIFDSSITQLEVISKPSKHGSTTYFMSEHCVLHHLTLTLPKRGLEESVISYHCCFYSLPPTFEAWW